MMGAPARQRRMVSLGKVAAPKPINLPSQKKENNGNDPSVNLIGKSGGWATGGAASGSSGEDASAAKQPERAIPAQPAPAWGGAGLPEERKKQVEMAAQQEYPIYDGPGRHAYDDDPRRRPWDADERSYAGPPPDGPHRGRYHYGPSSQDARFDPEYDSRPPHDRYGYERPRFEGHHDRYDRYGDRERHGPPPRHYGSYEDDYGPPRRGGYYDRERDGPHTHHHGHSHEERDRELYGGPYGHARGPPAPFERDEPGVRRGGYRDERDWGEHPRRNRSPLPTGPPSAGHEPGGPAGPPAAGLDGSAAPAYAARPPPPPPPRRALQQPNGPSSEHPAAPQQQQQQPLERTSSLHSDASTQQSDSTLASSRLATLGSSMPRSEPGSLADAAELPQHRQQLETAGQTPLQVLHASGVLSPRSAAQQQQQQQQAGPMQPGYPVQQQPTRILKREPQANGVAHGHPQPGTTVNLPSEASLLDHLSSPPQQHATGMPAGGPLPQQQGSAMLRGVLPAQHAALAAGRPVPAGGAAHMHPHQQRAPVTVVANFGGQLQQQQQPQAPGGMQQPALGVPSAAMHPGLLGHPQLAALEQQRQQQHAALPLVPTSLPLMTFGPPQQVPGGHPQYAAAPLGAPGGMLPQPHVQQQPQAMMQFGAIQLPSAIDGSVDAEAPIGGAEQPTAAPAAAETPLSAEAQRAYMKQKAAERARQLQQHQQHQQQHQHQQQGAGRRQDAGQRRPRVVPVVVAPPPPPPPRGSAAQPAPAQAGVQRQGARASRGGKASAQAAAATVAASAVVVVKASVAPAPTLARASSGTAPAADQGVGAAGAAGKPKRPRGGRKNKAGSAGEAASAASAAAQPAEQQPAQQPSAAPRAGAETEGKKRAVLVVPKRRPGAATAVAPAAEGAGVAAAPAPPPGLAGKKAAGGAAQAPPPGLSKGSSGAAAGAAAAPVPAASDAASAAASEANGAAAGSGSAGKRKPRGSRGKGGKGAAAGSPPAAAAAAAGEASKEAGPAADSSAGAGEGGEPSGPGGGRGRGRGRSGRAGAGGRGGQHSSQAAPGSSGSEAATLAVAS